MKHAAAIVSVGHGVMMQRKQVRAGVARSSKWQVCRRTGEKWTRRRGQLEEHTVVVRQREVQRRDMRRPLRKRGVPGDVDSDFAAVFECCDHVRSRQKGRKV